MPRSRISTVILDHIKGVPTAKPTALEEEKSLQEELTALYNMHYTKARTGVTKPTGEMDFKKLVAYCVPTEFKNQKAPIYRRSSNDASRELYLKIADRLKECAMGTTPNIESLKTTGVLPDGIGREMARLYKANNNIDNMLCFMLGVSFLERLFVEITLWHYSNTGNTSAITMRQVKITDILASSVLEETLGTPMLMLFRSFIGPLHGIALRNLVWHNFIPTSEWQPAYTAFLISIITTFDKSDFSVITTHPSATVNIRHVLKMIRSPDEVKRDVQAEMLHEIGFPADTAPRIAPLKSTFLTGASQYSIFEISEQRTTAHKGGPLFDLNGYIQHIINVYGMEPCPEWVEQVMSERKSEIDDIIDAGCFFLDSRNAEWKAAFEKACRKDWHASGILATVLLESALRRMHSALNDLDARWPAPDRDELFTIIDDMLNGKENALPKWLHKGSLHALYDHWVWKEGFRIRDDLAHGSVTPNCLSYRAVVPILAVSLQISLAVHISANPEFRVSSGIQKIIDWVEGYTPLFSPWTLLQTEMRLFQSGGMNDMEHTCRLIHERGSGFPPPPEGTKQNVTVEQRQKQNERREDDPNRLPSNMACYINAIRQYTGKTNVEAMQWEHPALHDIEFVGKPANVQNKELIKLHTTRRIVSSCHQFAVRLAKTYTTSYELVWARKAYKKQRIAYARLLEDVPTLTDMIRLAFTFAVQNVTFTFPNDENIREACLNFVFSLLHQAERKQWYRALPEYELFVSRLDAVPGFRK